MGLNCSTIVEAAALRSEAPNDHKEECHVTNRAIASIKPALATNLEPDEMPSWMTILFAIASGLLAANVYYSQPITELIAPSLGFSSSATRLIVPFTQAGFGTGRFLIAPLGDLVENGRLGA